MNLIEKLSAEDIKKINNYVSYYGGANGEFMGAEKWLKDWSNNKKKLYKLFGNNLILSMPFSLYHSKRIFMPSFSLVALIMGVSSWRQKA